MRQPSRLSSRPATLAVSALSDADAQQRAFHLSACTRQVGRLVEALLDGRLRPRWEAGEFVWPDGLQDAYPRSDYWWLYGAPRAGSS